MKPVEPRKVTGIGPDGGVVRRAALWFVWFWPASLVREANGAWRMHGPRGRRRLRWRLALAVSMGLSRFLPPHVRAQRWGGICRNQPLLLIWPGWLGLEKLLAARRRDPRMFLASLRRRMPHGLLAGFFMGVSAAGAPGFTKVGGGEYSTLRLSQAQLASGAPSGAGGGASAPGRRGSQGQGGAGSGGAGGSPSKPADLSPSSPPNGDDSLDGPAAPQLVQTLANLSPPETPGPSGLDEAPFNLAGNPGAGSSGGGFLGGGGGGGAGGGGVGGGAGGSPGGGEQGGGPGGVPGGGQPPIIPHNPDPTGPVLPPIDQTGPGPEGPNPPYVPGEEAGTGPGPDLPTPPGGQQPPRPTTPVPEPSSWLLLIVGFGGLGATLRARRQRRPASLAGG